MRFVGQEESLDNLLFITNKSKAQNGKSEETGRKVP